MNRKRNTIGHTVANREFIHLSSHPKKKKHIRLLIPLVALFALLALLLAVFTPSTTLIHESNLLLNNSSTVFNLRTKKKHGKNLVLTAHIISDECNDVQCHATRTALQAATECAARTMGSLWEAMIVSDMQKDFESSQQDDKNKHFPTPSEWPFPHYVKIHTLERLLLLHQGANDARDLDWILWVDADVRIVNASFPVPRLLDEETIYERAPYYGKRVDEEKNGHLMHHKSDLREGISSSINDDQHSNDLSLVVMSQRGLGGNVFYANIINNVFFLKNNLWGRRFMRAWKYFTLNAANGEKNQTCGWYDQCPFGIAVLQIAQDYYWMHQQQEHLNLPEAEEWLQSRDYNASLEHLAFHSGSNIQDTLFHEELVRLTSSQRYNNIPLQIGPILLIPTWGGNLRLPGHGYDSVKDDSSSNDKYDFVPSLLTVEPANAFDKSHNTKAWPFAIHAKYSQLFCLCYRDRKRKKRVCNHNTTGTIQYKASHLQDQCTSTELSSMRNDHVPCWAKWKT